MKKFFAILMSALMILSCVCVMTVTTSAADYTCEEAAKLTSFPEKTFRSYFANPNQTEVIFNDDGSITFKGTWAADTAPLDPFVSFNYAQFLRRSVDKKLQDVPMTEDYGALALKVKIDASVAGNFCMFIAAGSESSITASTPTFTPDIEAEGTGDFEYLIFDLEGYLEEGRYNVMRLDWVNDIPAASEETVGASMTLYEFCFYKDYDEALAACGFEVPTEPEKTEPENSESDKAESEESENSASADNTAAESGSESNNDKDDKADKDEEKKSGCGAAVVSVSALTVVVAACAAVALKKKED